MKQRLISPLLAAVLTISLVLPAVAVVAQFPEFQETYDIRPGDGMYVAPEDRIVVWGMPENTDS